MINIDKRAETMKPVLEGNINMPLAVNTYSRRTCYKHKLFVPAYNKLI